MVMTLFSSKTIYQGEVGECIQDLITSRDGQIRSAKILLPSKKMLGLALSLLYPIECQPNGTGTNCLKRDESQSVSREQNNDTGNISKLDHEHVSIQRPKRQAASKAKQRISEQLRDE